MMRLPRHVFQQRRQALLAQLPPQSVAIVAAATLQHRNRDTEYAFRQHSDFYYLTGFNEPDALLVLRPGRAEGEVVLFCPPRDPAMEVWTGLRAGPEGCVSEYGMDQAFALDQLEQQMPALLNGVRSIHYALGADERLDQRVRAWLNQVRACSRQGYEAPEELVLLDNLLHEMRLFKCDTELALMQQAAEISAAAHCHLMSVCRPGMMEYQLEAEFVHACAVRGGRFQAYTPIVASGANACILHYVHNDAVMQAGDLVLVDAGCELDCYASDITRTFPVSGRFSDEQRALYQLVLDVQERVIDAVRPGVAWDSLHACSVEWLTRGLVELGLLQGSVDALVEAEAYKPFYMHRIGHWLGMDVHDVGQYKQAGEWRTLAAGMVFTVEPGIYVASDNLQVEPRWRGIGIRIEDDVVVTETGCCVLTAGVPKRIEAIEAMMQRARG